VRTGYAFIGWSRSADATEAQYTAGQTIRLTSNTTLYAVWQQQEATPPVTTPPATVTDTGGTGTGDPASNAGADNAGTDNAGADNNADADNTAANNSANSAANADANGSSPLALLSGDGEVVTQEELREIARDAGVPLVGIGENGVPLVGIEGYAFWSLVDLAIVLAGILFAVWQIFAYRRRRDEYDRISPEAETNKPVRRMFILMLVAALANVALFLLTQDFTGTPLVMVDIWTIPGAALLTIECVLGRNASKRARVTDENAELGTVSDIRRA
jgi:uncharacterized repeat protein (TIGR02543 family)